MFQTSKRIYLSICCVFVVFASVVVFGGCHKDDDSVTGDLTISFAPRYDNEDFATLKSFAYDGHRAIKWSKFDFYVTGISLITPTGKKELTDVALIDFTATDVSNRLIKLDNLPVGNYTGIEFNIGVGTSQNKKQPKDFSSNNALSSTSHYWDAWDSYIFSKMEGVFDTSGLKTFDLGFAVHTGTDACLQRVSILKNFEITETAGVELPLDIDIKNVYSSGGNFFDIPTSPLNHNPSNIETLTLFSSRLAQAVHLKN